FWAIVHSHTASPARPSPTDLREAHYPEALYVLVSLSPAEADPATGAESVRAWRIVDGGVHEVEVRLDGWRDAPAARWAARDCAGARGRPRRRWRRDGNRPRARPPCLDCPSRTGHSGR